MFVCSKFFGPTSANEQLKYEKQLFIETILEKFLNLLIANTPII